MRRLIAIFTLLFALSPVIVSAHFYEPTFPAIPKPQPLSAITRFDLASQRIGRLL